MEEKQSLKHTTKKGLYWSIVGTVANQGIRFVFGIVLARLLSPNDYGIIGILAVFMSVVSVFIDCGFSQALICKQNRTQKDFSTEFYFNIGVGLIGYLILFAAAPFIAIFYDMPILTPILRILGLGVIINSLCVVQGAQFAIKLDFKTPAKLAVVTQLVSGAFGIVLAYNGWGVWALVFQQVTGGLLNAILLWLFAGWRPTVEFSKTSFNYLWGYGSKILGASLIQQVYDNIYPLVIGKFFTVANLGQYSRAQGFASLPSGNLSGILNNLTFPILSRLNNDMLRLKDVYRRMIRSTAFIVFPLMIGMAVLSSSLVKVLLNELWYDCIPMLQALCLALMFQPLSVLQLNFFKATRRTDILLKVEIIKRIIGILSIILSIPFGIMGLCYGYIILYIICFFLNTFYTNKILEISFWSQIVDIIPPIIASFAMSLIIHTIILFFNYEILRLTLGGLAGIVVYYFFARLFMKKMLSDTILLIRK